jgi:hypothetical protein
MLGSRFRLVPSLCLGSKRWHTVAEILTFERRESRATTSYEFGISDTGPTTK